MRYSKFGTFTSYSSLTFHLRCIEFGSYYKFNLQKFYTVMFIMVFTLKDDSVSIVIYQKKNMLKLNKENFFRHYYTN